MLDTMQRPVMSQQSAAGTVQDGHAWVGAATVPVDQLIAAKAHKDGSMSLPELTVVSILDVYCEACRRPYDDVAGEVCEVRTEIGNAHLRGGPIGVRRNRKCPIHQGLYSDCKADHEPDGRDHNYGRPPMPSLEDIAGWR